jgi:hypothetical protein
VTVTYQSRVAEARRLTEKSEDAQWALARLSFEVVNSGQATLATWAADIDLSEGRVSNYIKVWDRYADPSTRNPKWTFNDHSEVARLTDEKATAIIARAEREGISIGIARKRISQEDTHRKRFEAEREADLAAALSDTGNALAGHQQAVQDARSRIIEDRARSAAGETTKPLLMSATQMLVHLLPDNAKKVRSAIEQANSLGLDIPEVEQILIDLRAAVAEVEFHAAKRGITTTAGGRA